MMIRHGSFCSGCINGTLLHCHSCFLQGFGKSRVTVNGTGDIFGAGPQLNCQNAFGDHVRRPWTDDVHPQNPIGFLVGNDFHKPFGFAHTTSSAGAGERKSPGTIGNVAFFDLLFSEPHTCRFRPGVDDRRYGIIIYFAGLAGNAFSSRNPLSRGFVGQHRSRGKITDGVDAGDICAI